MPCGEARDGEHFDELAGEDAEIGDYVRQTLEEVPRAGFTLERGPVEEPWEDWTRTRYEAKALREGRAPRYLTFRRA